MAKAPNVFNTIAVDFCWLCQDQRVQWWRRSSVRRKQISGVGYYIRAINLGGLWNHIFRPICTVYLQLFGQPTPINSVNSRRSWWIDWQKQIDSGNAKKTRLRNGNPVWNSWFAKHFECFFFLHASFESQVIRAPSLSSSCCYSLAVKSLEYFPIVPGYDFHTRVNKS